MIVQLINIRIYFFAFNILSKMKSENIEKMVMAQLSPNLSSSNPKNSKK